MEGAWYLHHYRRARRRRLVGRRPVGLVGRCAHDHRRSPFERGARDDRLLNPAVPSRHSRSSYYFAQLDRGCLRPCSRPDGWTRDLVRCNTFLGKRGCLGRAVDLDVG